MLIPYVVAFYLDGTVKVDEKLVVFVVQSKCFVNICLITNCLRYFSATAPSSTMLVSISWSLSATCIDGYCASSTAFCTPSVIGRSADVTGSVISFARSFATVFCVSMTGLIFVEHPARQFSR